MNRSHSSNYSLNNASSKFAINRLKISLLIPAFILVAISLVTLYSIDTSLFRAQIVFLIGSLIVYFLFLNIDYKIFGIFAKYLYGAMILLLAGVLLIGVEAKGAIRWISFFGVNVQFSEIIKPFYIIFMAYFLSRNDSKSFAKFIQCLLLLLPIFFLTLKQPDLGNAIIYVIVTLFMMLMYGFSLWYFLLLGIVFLIPLPLLFNLLHGYQKARLVSFMNINADPLGSSYNAIQALISVGSGQFFGKGFMGASQSILKFLPERQTDFIFATISESLGFVGSTILMGAFGYLLYKFYRISQEVDDIFSYLIIIGFYFLLFVHIFFNVGMNIGLLPIVGITLPFVSYGGSSLLTNFIILGITSSVNFEFRRHHSIEIR